MGINLGQTSMKAVYLGQTAVKSVFFGSNQVWSGEEPVPTAEPLCFTLDGTSFANAISLNKFGSPDPISIEYSTDGNTWSDYTWDGNTGLKIQLTNNGDKAYFRAKTENQTISNSASNYYVFATNGLPNSLRVSGNVQTLLKADGSRTDAPAYCYYYLLAKADFKSAPSLPATTLATYCYGYMFGNCTNLTTAPELPATTLAQYCYYNMFRGCTSLTSAPASLPATTLADYCYQQMFYGCSNLTTAPSLPATTLGQYCYRQMFQNCTSMTAAPELPAQTITAGVYNSMFRGCTSLTTAPALPATTLAYDCYSNMFNDCSSLSSVEVAFTTWTNGATTNWLQNVAASGTFTCPAELPDTRDNSHIPEGWTKAENAQKIPLTFTAQEANSTVHLDKNGSPNTISLETSTDGITWTDYSWTDNTGDTLTLANVGDKVYMRAKTENQTIGSSGSKCYKFVMSGSIAASGNIQTLLKADGSRTDAPAYCYINMFSECSSLKTAPELPAMTLASYCYSSMFYNCQSLTTAPALPATTLANYCYSRMFWQCLSMTSAPELPATTLADYCYQSMFYNCNSLTTAPALPATTLARQCYDNMFNMCRHLTVAPVLPATTLAYGCYSHMFDTCERMTTVPALSAQTLSADYCCNGMFAYCYILSSVTVQFTSWTGGANPTGDWMRSVQTTSGTFTCPAELPDIRDESHIPTGWTKVDAA